MSFYNKFSDGLIASLRQALAETDSLAYHNVTHDEQGESILDSDKKPITGKFSRGGPFGAMLALSHKDDSLEIIGTPRGNNVVGSGIASRHAEDQALQSDNYRLLVERLITLRKQGESPLVWMISSGQSCTNCHTKQEIMARDLVARGLIEANQFFTLYGATYDDTFQIAQFYDAQYADAMILFSQDPKNPSNLIRQEPIRYENIPTEVQEIFKNAEIPTAVIMRHGEIYAIGQEARTEFELYETAEVNAVRAACARNRSEGAFASWEVDGELYTTSSQIGPLLFAEAGWTKIGTVKSVQMPAALSHLQYYTLETASLSNTEFLQIVAGGYKNPEAFVQVVRDQSFNNTAQRKWAEMLAVNGEQLYNGAAVSPGVEDMRTFTRFRFSACDIGSCDCAPIPLRALTGNNESKLDILEKPFEVRITPEAKS